MKEDRRVTVRSVISELNRMVLLLAVAVLAASIAAFFIVAITLHQVLWQELLLAIISNIISSVLIYIALYFSLSRVTDLRLQVWREELLEGIDRDIKTSLPVSAPVINAIPADPLNNLIAHSHIRPDQRDIIQRFLEATYLLVAAFAESRDIRLYCHIADENERLLYPVCIVSTHINDDYRVAIPYDGPDSRAFIIAKAMQQQRIVAEDLPQDHRDQYPEDLKLRILATLKCVIAVPIEPYVPAERRTVPLGTISIDCTSASLEELHMVDSRGVVVNEMNDILKSCSRVVHQVLTI
jgi:hypothetical protein